MAVFHITKGKDIRLKGPAVKKIADCPLPKCAAIQPGNFKGIKPHLAVQAGSVVKVGTPLFADKARPDLKVVSSVSGRVTAVNRGEKRVLLEIVVEPDGRQDAEQFRQFTKDQIPSLSREDVCSSLLMSGLWPVLRQRPFSKIANPQGAPKSIFIHAMNTEPLAADVDFLIDGREDEFQAGLDVLKKLTSGPLHLCIHAKSTSKALTQAQNAQVHRFSGPHPSGNVSTHIHCVDPINKGDVVWYVEAQDVVRIGALFLRGTYSPERIVAVTGEGASERLYKRTVIGAPMDSLAGEARPRMRYLSGSVLTGRSAGSGGFLDYYDSQITVIPEGGHREFLGWLWPGFNKFSLSKTFASSFLPQGEVALDTDTKGSERAIVMNSIYDAYVPLDILTYFLIKAVLIGDIEEAEKLGILECEEEDFALCAFACPSKVDVGGIIRRGLDLVEREG